MTANEQHLDAGLTEAARTNEFSGVALLADRTSIVCQRAFGEANRADGVPNRLDTRFGIASTTKMFTAAAVAQLVEQGRLSFKTPVRECLPYLKGGFDGVTAHHLLTHTSGIADYFDEGTHGPEAYADLWKTVPSYSMRQPKNFLPLFADLAAYARPGECFRYSNAGYILLGLIIEQITGQGYCEHVSEAVFARAGMADTGFFELDAVVPRMATGYIPKPAGSGNTDGGWRSNHFSIPARGGPDGGAFTTAKDLWTFLLALERGKILAPSIAREVLAPKVRASDSSSYGYGMWIHRRPAGCQLIGHDGEDPGCSARAYHVTQPDVYVIVLSNISLGAGAMFRKILELVCAS